MGRKHGRKRVYLLLYVACIFIAAQAAVGCAHLSKSFERDAALKNARQMMEQGDFNGALAENKKALSQPLQLSKDRVLFQRGLIYFHPRNPDPDYFKAAEYFQRVVDQYPRSSLGDAAASLILLLHQNLNREADLRILTEKTDWMQKMLSERRQWMEDVLNAQRSAVYQYEEKSEKRRLAAEKLAAENAQLQEALRKQRTQIDTCRQESTDREKLLGRLSAEVEELKSHIQKLKKIDLNIEKRKKSADIK